jgi:hypothetical protein
MLVPSYFKRNYGTITTLALIVDSSSSSDPVPTIAVIRCSEMGLFRLFIKHNKVMNSVMNYYITIIMNGINFIL